MNIIYSTIRYNAIKYVFALAIFVMACLNAGATIHVSGYHKGNITWDEDTVKVEGDVHIVGRLTITPGTYIEFQGSYLIGAMALTAIGEADSPIVFTVSDTAGFYDENTNAGGWNTLELTPECGNAEFKHCVFQYGKKIFADSWGDPGIVRVMDTYSSVSFDSCIFENNFIASEGSVLMSERYANISRCIFRNNKGNAMNLRNAEVLNCNVCNNNGNGILSWAGWSLELSDNIITDNTGFGVSMEDADYINIFNNEIYRNYGGILCFSADTGNIAGNKIFNNKFQGGGIYVRYNENKLNISNNVICNNGLGILLCESQHVIVSNNTISNNHGGFCGGVQLYESQAQLYNNIIYGNTSVKEFGNQVYAENNTFYTVDFLNNDIKMGDHEFTVNEGLGIFENNIDSDPQFVLPTPGTGSDHDATIADWSLECSSLCINSGNSGIPDICLPDTDIEGNPRISSQELDIGAYEFYSGIGITQQPQDISACFGENVSLEIDGTELLNIRWQKDQVDIPGATKNNLSLNEVTEENEGEYRVIVWNCLDTLFSDTVYVVVDPLPEIDLGDNIEAHQDSTVILDAGGGYTYLWNNGETTQTIEVNEGGEYRVQVTDTNGCQNSDTILVAFTLIEDIHTQPARNVMHLYPNPFTEKLVISLYTDMNVQIVRLYDITGNLVRTEKNLTKKPLEIFREDLISGVYILEVICEVKVYLQKIIAE